MHFLEATATIFISKPKKVKNKNQFSDEDLAFQIQATNNILSFGLLYDRYSNKVFGKCLSFANNKEEAEDLTQDVFIKLFTKIHKFKGQSKFSTWLYALTYNFCVNYVNRDKSKKMANATDRMELHEYNLSKMEDVKDEDIFNLDIDVLEEALEKITPEDKALLLLKYQDDIPIKDLQIVYKVSKSAIKMRLKRARIRVIAFYYV